MSGGRGRFRGEFARRAVLGSWVVLVGLVVMGSLLPAGSPVVAAAGRLPLTDKAMHFLAYLGLSVLLVVGFRERRRGLAAGMAMFGLGCLLEFAQQFSPGRGVDLLDLAANGAGVGCGLLLAQPVRGWMG